MSDCRQANQPAPVLHHNSYVLEVHRLYEAHQRAQMHPKGVCLPLGEFIGPPEADEVHSDNTVLSGHGGNHFAV